MASIAGGRKLKLAVPDLISNSYFPAAAAVELGFFAREGLDISLELIFPVSKCYEALRDGSIDFVGGAAHGVLSAFPDWSGAKLIAAQSRGMYWFLVMRADLGTRRNDLDAVKGKRIGAAPWVEMGLRQLLLDAGYDLARDNIEIVGIPPDPAIGPNFGLGAAKALEEGKIDGFWANGVGAEIAVTSGVGNIVLDIRRGDGPQGSFGYTFASIATTDRLIADQPETIAAAVRAIVGTQKALKADTRLATEVGNKLFPSREARLIAGIVARDLPYYDASIAPETVVRLNEFCGKRRLLQDSPSYAAVVEPSVIPLWTI